ncbi:hypothetical protein [Methylobrevis pamukkalensis]|nr:hypothetical protein [Methylobrevis pamukkalensis]
MTASERQLRSGVGLRSAFAVVALIGAYLGFLLSGTGADIRRPHPGAAVHVTQAGEHLSARETTRTFLDAERPDPPRRAVPPPPGGLTPDASVLLGRLSAALLAVFPAADGPLGTSHPRAHGPRAPPSVTA